MSVLVKICGLTDSVAVATAVEAGADAVGFVFYRKSPRNLTVEQAAGLIATVPSGVLRVAVMLHPEAEFGDRVIRELQPDVVQTDLADFDYLSVPEHVQRWPVVRENEVNDAALPARFVYEGRASGQGMQVDWAVAAGHARRGEMILAGGLDAENVAAAIRQVSPWGVDVSSAVESAPGVKDPDRIREFIAATKTAQEQGKPDEERV